MNCESLYLSIYTIYMYYGIKDTYFRYGTQCNCASSSRNIRVMNYYNVFIILNMCNVRNIYIIHIWHWLFTYMRSPVCSPQCWENYLLYLCIAVVVWMTPSLHIHCYDLILNEIVTNNWQHFHLAGKNGHRNLHLHKVFFEDIHYSWKMELS